MQYIKPTESIILNVLSASVDFPTCESIRMSQQVDRTGERTLAVVTKADKSPEGLLEKVAADDVNIGLGYVCVRNRIGSETYEEARVAEANMFQTHPLLSKIDKSIVGVPILANKLMQIQAQSIAKCLPDIVKKINEKLNRNVSDLEVMPQHLASVADAMRAFMQVISKTKEILRKLLIRGEFDDYPNDKEMHGTARVAQMLSAYAAELPRDVPIKKAFLMEEIEELEEARGIGLPNFLPRSAFTTLLQKMVKDTSSIPQQFVMKIWSYVENVVVRVLDDSSENYPSLQACNRKAAQNLIGKMRRSSIQSVREILEMETLTDYTFNPDYMKMWAELMELQQTFMEVLHDSSKPTKLNLKIVGDVDVAHLRGRPDVVVEQAFDMRMRLIAYWKIVFLRLVDVLALQILYAVKKLVEDELETEILNEVVGGQRMNGLDKMLEEFPSTSGKRERLMKSIQLLKESKEVVANIIDRISLCAGNSIMKPVQSNNSVESKSKKMKNFLWSLKPEWISGLLQIMAEYVDANMRSSQGFKDAVYQGVAKKMKEKFGIDVTSEQCKNQVRHQRNIWNHIQELKKKSGVSWDDNKKMILMGNDEYLSHIQAFPKDAAYLNIPISNYMDLEKVCGEGHATGQWAKSANSQTPLGTEEINLEEDDTPIFVELDLNTVADFESLEVENNKRAKPSSSKSNAKSKKTKISEVDQSLREYIVIMADSVTQVANAIQNTSRVAEEKKMFTELIADLLNIPGFCKEEISFIYDNLSKNPTMIQSFLAKPVDMKASWMRQELDKWVSLL